MLLEPILRDFAGRITLPCSCWDSRISALECPMAANSGMRSAPLCRGAGLNCDRIENCCWTRITDVTWKSMSALPGESRGRERMKLLSCHPHSWPPKGWINDALRHPFASIKYPFDMPSR